MDAQLLQGKQVLSARLLGIGLRANVATLRRTFRVEEAVAGAARNVHAVGIGRKVVEGKPTKEMAIRLYVVQKLAPSLLPPRDRLPDSVDGILTDVIESSPAFLTARARRVQTKGYARRASAAAVTAAASASCTVNKQKQQRPLVAGISVAHHDVTAGTIAYFCRSVRLGDDPNKVHILSNNHVLANVNLGQNNDDIYQPGPADGGALPDHVAELRRFVAIDLDGQPNKVDAAIAELRAGIEWQANLCTIGKILGTETGVEGMQVRKHGRTTGYTEGTITDESYDALVGMDHNNPSVVGLFQSQFRIEGKPDFPAFGRGGDSGSLVVSKAAPNAVGLYFAGPESGSYGIANPIADVLSQMQIELLTDVP
jgi:hypothetical protein